MDSQMYLIMKMVRGAALFGMVLQVATASDQGDVNCPETQPEDSTSCPDSFAPFVRDCQYGMCPYDDTPTTLCNCFFDGWFCFLEFCPDCPLFEPTTGDPCFPELTTEACDFNKKLCSGVGLGGTTCLCNPSTSLFECTTSEEMIDSCPSAPCPEELPNRFSFCDEPFGPGNFDGGVSDTCTYRGETCCERTGECTFPVACGCDVNSQWVRCEAAFLDCPELCPESAPMPFELCDTPVTGCNYGECPYDLSSGSTSCKCDVFSGEWSCEDACPSCPSSQPVSGDPCFPEFTTEECDYDVLGLCSDVLLFGSTCQCNPDTSLFECTANDLAMDALTSGTCPSAPCPEERPPVGLFCDEPIGPGHFDNGRSDTCTYGEAICCESTGECVEAFNCGCNLGFAEIFCGPFIVCPDFCPETPPENGEDCDISFAVDCFYNFNECLGPDVSTYDCFCESGVFMCFDFCNDESDPTASPTEDTGMEGGMMGMSGGMKGEMMGGFGKGGGMKMGTSKSQETRFLGVTETRTTLKRHRGVFRGN